MPGVRALRELADLVAQEYEQMGIAFGDYQKSSGLTCLSECGKCCKKPDIEVSVLEILPLALHLYDCGLAQESLDKIEVQDICISYHSTNEQLHQGRCQFYKYRPSICRMFGASGYSNKQDAKTSLSACKLIKETYPHLYQVAVDGAIRPPKISTWSARVKAIDASLGNDFYPINIALKKALEKILVISQYESELA